MAGARRGRLAGGPGRRARAARARRRGRPQDRDRARPAMAKDQPRRPGITEGSESEREGAIVGIDTATSATSVAVLVAGGREVERRDDPGAGERPRHAETLQPLLERALEQAEVGWDGRRAHLRRHRPGRLHRAAARDRDRARARAGPRSGDRRRLEPRGARPRDRAREPRRSSTCPAIPTCTARCWR